MLRALRGNNKVGHLKSAKHSPARAQQCNRASPQLNSWHVCPSSRSSRCCPAEEKLRPQINQAPSLAAAAAAAHSLRGWMVRSRPKRGDKRSEWRNQTGHQRLWIPRPCSPPPPPPKPLQHRYHPKSPPRTAANRPKKKKITPLTLSNI